MKKYWNLLLIKIRVKYEFIFLVIFSTYLIHKIFIEEEERMEPVLYYNAK